MKTFLRVGAVSEAVQGARATINRNSRGENINSYGEESEFRTPTENPYIIDFLQELGFNSIESLLDNNNLFTRKFE